MQRSAISKEIATIIRCLIFLLLASAASATDITELIRAAKHQPDIQDSELAITESGLQEELPGGTNLISNELNIDHKGVSSSIYGHIE